MEEKEEAEKRGGGGGLSDSIIPLTQEQKKEINGDKI